MLKPILSLSAGTATASGLAVEAVYLIQAATNTELGPNSLITGTIVVQLAFLITAIGMLLYAGRIIGQWQSTQNQMTEDVDELTTTCSDLQRRISQIEGGLKVLQPKPRTKRNG